MDKSELLALFQKYVKARDEADNQAMILNCLEENGISEGAGYETAAEIHKNLEELMILLESKLISALS